MPIQTCVCLCRPLSWKKTWLRRRFSLLCPSSTHFCSNYTSYPRQYLALSKVCGWGFSIEFYIVTILSFRQSVSRPRRRLPQRRMSCHSVTVLLADIFSDRASRFFYSKNESGWTSCSQRAAEPRWNWFSQGHVLMVKHERYDNDEIPILSSYWRWTTLPAWPNQSRNWSHRLGKDITFDGFVGWNAFHTNWS